ncbi:CNNM domain-containing protein [Stieleria sp. TO1_6]|uniref:CNNM domain-containing protein n=1 Tax=Stieleria tagensis TaxID=2956795 RepID=UPI00209BACB7|nr:CNNM domain-containing protein [Stieleria tagensis]MCO8120336.1 CNNM domain-containing protein [Stieleria tagensis]
MIVFAILLFLFGLVLSAFFSGSETGLYRVSRTRLVLDGLDGSRGAKAIVWLLNHPTLFVATALVGNNLANFLTSFALVLAIGSLYAESALAELIGPILMTPIVFVFGELLPKHWFFQAPYRLLCRVRPLLLLATVLFLPVSLLLAALAVALRALTGQTPFRLRLAMARGELAQVLRAGEEAGILHAGQRSLAGQLFDVGNQLAISFAVPLGRLSTVRLPIDRESIASEARRRNHPIVLVLRGDRIVGYLRYSELLTGEGKVEVRPVIRVSLTERHLTTLLRLYDVAGEVALLCDEHGDARSVVTRRQLLQPMIK